MVALEEITRLVLSKKMYITDHAWEAMGERNINSSEVIDMVVNGEIIEEYLDAKPCPSFLILARTKNRTIHIVLGLCKEHVREITTYEPDPDRWIDTRYRKNKNQKKAGV